MDFKTSNHLKMLMKIYYLYQNSPKRLRKLKKFSNALEEVLSKPSQAYGTCWLGHKFWLMEILLNHYGTYMVHIESLSQTDSQATKRAKLWGFVKKWKHASFPIHTAIFLVVLSWSVVWVSLFNKRNMILWKRYNKFKNLTG